MRCLRASIDDACDRCKRNNRSCQIPPSRPLGRRPGAVGKYRGLDKALRHVQLELRKARRGSDAPDLEGLEMNGMELAESASPRQAEDIQTAPAQVHTENEAVSNPLALLADASEAAQESEGVVDHNIFHGRHLLSRPGYVSLGLRLDRQCLEEGLEALFVPDTPCRYSNYFKPVDSHPPRDTGPDVDPVDLGLVSMEDAEYLFLIYFARLHPINGILDPVLHTPSFVRSQSALLFTWILALTSQFDAASASMAKRLRLHGEKLSRHVHTCGYKSVDIVQGYYISLLSATPANTLAEERSWLYTNYAFGLASELGLDQRSGRICSTDSNGIDHQRLSRNKERTWLRILLWERANSAARGRATGFPETDLTLSIDDWWLHPLADPADKYTAAFILLRRRLAALNHELQSQSNRHHSNPHWVRGFVDTALQPWFETWLQSASNDSSTFDGLSNLFMRHVYLHGRLWTLSFALHGSLDGDSEAIREDCFDSAVHCCEVTVQDLQQVGEPLYCMLAPTWAMISYAAVLALRLFPLLHGGRPGYEVELLALLSQVAIQLEKAGTTPSSRFGIAALLGQHLTMILRARARGLKESVGEVDYSPPMQGTQQDAMISTFDPFLTSAMWDDDGSAEGLTDLHLQLFGQGFGGVGL
ncbi:hypothetical protein AWENTII_012942 [Aspergillus wentii]